MNPYLAGMVLLIYNRGRIIRGNITGVAGMAISDWR
jgi:hypothetical protein